MQSSGALLWVLFAAIARISFEPDPLNLPL